MRKLVWLLLASGIALAGCAQFGWVKDGVTRQEASQDAHTCLREAQQRDLGATSPYGVLAQDAVVNDPQQYRVCMAAHGYSWQQMQATRR